MGRICELKSTAAVADETVSASAPAARRENEVNDRSMRGSARVSRLVGECHFRFLAEMIWPTEHTKHAEEIEWASRFRGDGAPWKTPDRVESLRVRSLWL